MRDTMTVAGWVGGAMLLSVSLLVLCQHAEGERTRSALRAAQTHVDKRIRTLDARLTDLQADANRRKLTNITNPPLDAKRLAKASKELDQLIEGPAVPVPTPATAEAETAPSAALGVMEATLSPESGEPVRVCPGGRYYHRHGCRRVKKQTHRISRAAAENQGYNRCPTCRP